MASNLIELFNNTVGELLARQSSGILSESAESTTTAVKLIAPSLLGTLIQKVNTDAGAVDLMLYVAEHNIDGSILATASASLQGGIETEKLMYQGAGNLRYLLDDKLSPVVDSIAGASGLKTSSATSLLKLAAPLILGIIGKHIREKGLDAKGLKTLLADQSDSVRQSIPPGVAQLLGMEASSSAYAPPTPENTISPASQHEQSTFSKLLPWIILGLTSLALFYFVEKGCGKAPKAPPVEPEVIKDTVVTTPTPEPVNEMKTYKLPGGVALNVLPGSFTSRLADFLASSETGEKCIAFDQVDFESGSFKITAASEVQLEELLTIMKAYPYLRISLEAYTDDQGDDGKNKSLSRERAKVIKSWLTDKSIEPGRIDTKGMGEENPVATNKTEMGRAKNRRVEVCVKKK
jgi:OOP family OmpA-OmpF porin